MESLTIGEVARLAGIRPSAIRYYESLGLLPHPRRVSGQRRYDTSVLQALRIIQIAQEVGFKLDEIQVLFHGSPVDAPLSARWHPLARQKLGEVNVLIARAQIMKHLLEESLQCGCMSLEECALFIRYLPGASQHGEEE
jgi:MerR family redox-sensitive transcriptional activator SoxR